MAKSNRKKKIEAQNKKELRQIFTVVAAITVILLIILYLYYNANA